VVVHGEVEWMGQEVVMGRMLSIQVACPLNTRAGLLTQEQSLLINLLCVY